MEEYILYACFFGFALALTLYALREDKLVFSMISSIAWVILATSHFLGMTEPTPLKYGTGLFYFGMGMIMIFRTITGTLELLHDKRRRVDFE